MRTTVPCGVSVKVLSGRATENAWYGTPETENCAGWMEDFPERPCFVETAPALCSSVLVLVPGAGGNTTSRFEVDEIPDAAAMTAEARPVADDDLVRKYQGGRVGIGK